MENNEPKNLEGENLTAEELEKKEKEEEEKYNELKLLFEQKQEQAAESAHDFLAFHENISKYYIGLLDHFSDGDLRKRRLFHMIVLSSHRKENLPYLDIDVVDPLTGKTRHLIEDFIRSL